MIWDLENRNILCKERKEEFINDLRKIGLESRVKPSTEGQVATSSNEEQGMRKEGKSETDLTPVEIQARGPEAIKAYNEALEEGKTEVKQGRVIFVGLEGVGKTSTINSLLRKGFNPIHVITVSIATTTVCTQDDADETTLKEELPDTCK
ncbi:uncharacterized protein [Antedon mediterranea]|uniref:uncharacterized protein n=1 Tax=Antedon mediterranea TaxID=105859 RepID=UPI003AF8B79E